MPNNSRTEIRIETHEVTIIRFRRGEDLADVSTYEQRVIPNDLDSSPSSELPATKLREHSGESDDS